MTRCFAGALCSLLLAGCGREDPHRQAEQKAPAELEARFEAEPASEREGFATWYEVPDGSLADRRGEPGGLTAAHNEFELGAHVRVTDLKNNRSVIVEITDRGVPGSKTIDVSKEAAEALGIVERGRVKARMEVLREK